MECYRVYCEAKIKWKEDYEKMEDGGLFKNLVQFLPMYAGDNITLPTIIISIFLTYNNHGKLDVLSPKKGDLKNIEISFLYKKTEKGWVVISF